MPSKGSLEAMRRARERVAQRSAPQEQPAPDGFVRIAPAEEQNYLDESAFDAGAQTAAELSPMQGKLGVNALGLLQGATGHNLDEGAGLMNAALQNPGKAALLGLAAAPMVATAPGALLSLGARGMDALRENEDFQAGQGFMRGLDSGLADRFPVSSMVSEAIGSVAVPMRSGMIRGAPSLPPRPGAVGALRDFGGALTRPTAQMAKAGGVGGAVHGYGDSNAESASGRLVDAAQGGAAGVVVGGGLGAAAGTLGGGKGLVSRAIGGVRDAMQNKGVSGVALDVLEAVPGVGGLVRGGRKIANLVDRLGGGAPSAPSLPPRPPPAPSSVPPMPQRPQQMPAVALEQAPPPFVTRPTSTPSSPPAPMPMPSAGAVDDAAKIKAVEMLSRAEYEAIAKKALAAGWPAKDVARMTGVPEDVVMDVAKRLGRGTSSMRAAR